MRLSVWMLTVSLLLCAGGARADTATAAWLNGDDGTWDHWHGRLSLGTHAAAWPWGGESAASRYAGTTLMGDYYFKPSLGLDGLSGGLRATSGLIIGGRYAGAYGIASGTPYGTPADGDGAGERLAGLRGAAALAEGWDVPTQAYLGLGYTALSLRGGWSFSADLGLRAQNATGSLRLGRSTAGAQSLDDAVRELRLSPLLQFGVSYSF